ncbi:MAG: TonB-dependent receptor [Salibacter sp.]|uniref:TonB-dependent receptor n=1 Tax=Salibacter sp. TaxID=2010995 RepID=UPI0028705D4B|nr:TonB-dependent receptor [Salibacter sp.]MDR9398524.1 TonB-dependent receptor [Salibacter sp.]
MSSFSFTIEKHFCSGKHVDSAIFSETSCDLKQSKCDNCHEVKKPQDKDERKKKPGCCERDITPVVGNDFQIITQTTINRIGQKRLPITSSNPKEYQLDEKSSSYWTVNTQVSKTWKDFDLYVGAENLLNYRQPNPILASDEPFSDYFDASMVWGPVFGRVAYIGFRYKLK